MRQIRCSPEREHARGTPGVSLSTQMAMHGTFLGARKAAERHRQGLPPTVVDGKKLARASKGARLRSILTGPQSLARAPDTTPAPR